jgi:hypothetical protein
MWLLTASATQVAVFVAFGALGCLAAVLFSDHPDPADRLVKIINAVRDHTPRG